MARRKPIKFLTRDQLRERGIPYSDSHLRRLVADGRFPIPVKLMDGNCNATSVFVEAEIDAWQESRIKQRNAKRAAAAAAAAAAAELVENHA